MEIDTTPSSVATSALQALPFGNIIGGPLKACVEAQADAALTTWKFIQEVGLTDDGKGNRQLTYVTFNYRKNGRECVLNIPLLTIVPIPYIAIRDIDIAFKARISAAASTSETKKESKSTNFSNKTKVSGGTWFVRASTEFQAGFSSKKDSTATRDSKYSVEYTMDVAVKAGQDDMPAGMAKVLEMLNESVDSVDRGGELHVSSSVVNLQGDGMKGVYITFKGEDGFYKTDRSTFQLDILRHDGNKFAKAPSTAYVITDDDPGFICTFNEAGVYQFVAKDSDQEKKAQVTVQ